MAAFKCKMCGGALEFASGATVAECPFCGVKQTLPKLDDDRRANVFRRADHFRWQNEYDKAVAAYERLLEEDDRDAEAHWGIVLARYGIEYVEDPASHERIPTCHRVQPTSILTDADYLAARENAPDAEAARLYEQEAARIAEIQRNILAISGQEAPYDVFICYKESDESGARTKDSAIAQDVYYQLTNAGYRVFFSRITLEDKLGCQYEPYIFAALNSAKVMLVIGTKPEYFNAVWVKNEWGRYLALAKKDCSRLLIPCYRDMDAYDLPDELSMLQSQDMGRIGFIQDLLHGVEKVLKKETPAAAPVRVEEPVASAAGNITALLKRGYMSLEDGEWEKAKEFFEQALNQDAELGDAYLGLFLAGAKKSTFEKCVAHERERILNGIKERRIDMLLPEGWKKHVQEICEKYEIPQFLSAEELKGLYTLKQSYASCADSTHQAVGQAEGMLSKNRNLARALSFSRNPESLQGPWRAVTDELKRMEAQARAADAENERRLTEEAWNSIAERDEQAEKMYKVALERKESREAAEREREEMIQRNQQERTERRYADACRMAESKKIDSLASAQLEFRALNGYKDSERRAQECEQAIQKLRKKKKGVTATIISLVALVAAAAVVLTTVVLPAQRLKEAQAALAAGDFVLAVQKSAGSRSNEAKAVYAEAFYALGDQAAADGLYDVAAEYYAMANDYLGVDALTEMYSWLSLTNDADSAMPWHGGTYLLINEVIKNSGEVIRTEYYVLDPATGEVRSLTDAEREELASVQALEALTGTSGVTVAEELPRIEDADPGYTLITADGTTLHFPDWQWVGAGSYSYSTAEASLQLRNCGAVAVRVNGLWGLVDGNGEWLAAPEYKTCEEFSGGYALAQRPDEQKMVNGEYTTVAGEWVVLDTTGAVILESNGKWSPYNSYSSFASGWMRVNVGDKQGFINLQGELYDGELWKCTKISNGYGVVSDSYVSSCTVIDFETGKRYPLKVAYDDVVPDLENGVFKIEPYKSSGYMMNLRGMVISPKLKPNGFSTSIFFDICDDGRLVVVRNQDQYGVFELTGPVAARSMRTIAAAEWGNVFVGYTDTWESVMADHCGIFRVLSTGYHGKYGYISLDGTLVSPVRWEDATDFTPDGVAFVKADGLWAMLDTTGSFVVEPTWSEKPVYDAETDMYFVNVNGKWRMIDTAGDYVSEGVWDAQPEFSDGTAAVSVNGMWGYIDSTGATVIDFQYGEAGAFANGVALVRDIESRKYMLIDRSGNPLFDQTWDYVAPVNGTEGEYLVKTYMDYEKISSNGDPVTIKITVLHIVDIEGNIIW